MGKRIKVCIDPGHGGSDRWNRGSTGYVEADGVLTISRHLKDYLQNTGVFIVYMTRDSDKTMSLTARGMFAANNKVDLFLSEHTNAGGGKGTECYYSVDIPGDKEFAAALSKEVSKALGISNRGAKTKEYKKTKEDYMTVIDTAQDHGVPHVMLIESAFHDKIDEERLLLNNDNLKRIAEAQAKVICKFYGVFLDAPNEASRNENVINKANLVIDGYWGKMTTRELQIYLGTIVDGVISGQYHNNITESIPSVEFGTSGSMVIRKLQKLIGAKVDGYIGKETVGKLQRYLGTPVDGVISKPSLMVMEMQRRLNTGK